MPGKKNISNKIRENWEMFKSVRRGEHNDISDPPIYKTYAFIKTTENYVHLHKCNTVKTHE